MDIKLPSPSHQSNKPANVQKPKINNKHVHLFFFTPKLWLTGLFGAFHVHFQDSYHSSLTVGYITGPCFYHFRVLLQQSRLFFSYTMAKYNLKKLQFQMHATVLIF